MATGKQFAKVVWTAEDVKTLAPVWSLEECEEWLRCEERHIQDRLIELGWDVLEALLPDGVKGLDEDTGEGE